MRSEEDPYICVGVCMSDPDSGHCLGCGRPPVAPPIVVIEVASPVPVAPTLSSTGDPDTPAES